MKTIKGKLLLTVSAAAFVILVVASVVSAVVIGKASVGGAVGTGLLIGVIGTVVIDLIVALMFGKALAPLAELKQFASCDFIDEIPTST